MPILGGHPCLSPSDHWAKLEVILEGRYPITSSRCGTIPHPISFLTWLINPNRATFLTFNCLRHIFHHTLVL